MVAVVKVTCIYVSTYKLGGGGGDGGRICVWSHGVLKESRKSFAINRKLSYTTWHSHNVTYIQLPLNCYDTILYGQGRGR